MATDLEGKEKQTVQNNLTWFLDGWNNVYVFILHTENN